MALLDLCADEELREGEPLRVLREGHAYAVFRVGGDVYAIDDLCSHGPGNLSEGWLDGFEIECPFHQGRFDIRNGAPTAPPCWEPVRAWRPRLKGGRLVIDLDERG